MSDKTNSSEAKADQGGLPPELASARDALSKLPILGPALWLFAKDPQKKFGFIGDIDGTVLPPVILDQCRLYTKEGIPFAFFTWAKVSDDVDARLRGGQPSIAPHEWQSGEHLWMVDMVAPFGHLEEMFAELRKDYLPGQKVTALRPDPKQNGQLSIQEWDAA